ncbi:hypothetical protein ACFFX0_00080 [Citricoccus parietis]|uniref:ATP-binding cassette domain-containing protein n=1 Tax=Citricoccus parietis TaxID=592307 RepID=A0ABV5FST2_9MICC
MAARGGIHDVGRVRRGVGGRHDLCEPRPAGPHSSTRPLHTLSGGQRRRVELARILSRTRHPAPGRAHQHTWTTIRSCGCATSSRPTRAGSSSSTRRGPHGDAVNKVLYLDANRQVIDTYNMGWKTYLLQREQDKPGASVSTPMRRRRPRI